MEGTTVAGYKQATVRLEFPELSDPDDMIWVEIRNPKLLPGSFFTTVDDFAPAFIEEAKPDETVEQGQARLKGNQERINARMRDMSKMLTDRSMQMYASLVKSWHVYNSDGQPLTEPTPEAIADLPQPILGRMAKELQDAANPQ